MENRIYYLLTKTENVMSVYIKQQFQKAGLIVTPAQLGLLFLLKGRDGRTMTELSRELGTDNSGVTRTVDRMEKTGLVERNNSGDRREYRITITKAGMDEIKNARKIIDAINLKIADEFPHGEMEHLTNNLMRMYYLFKT